MATETSVRAALARVVDPEYAISIVYLGLICDVWMAAGGCRITMTFTSIGCPAMDMNIPAAAPPDSSIVDCWVKPSGARSLTAPSFGPRTATLSLIT